MWHFSEEPGWFCGKVGNLFNIGLLAKQKSSKNPDISLFFVVVFFQWEIHAFNIHILFDVTRLRHLYAPVVFPHAFIGWCSIWAFQRELINIGLRQKITWWCFCKVNLPFFILPAWSTYNSLAQIKINHLNRRASIISQSDSNAVINTKAGDHISSHVLTG